MGDDMHKARFVMRQFLGYQAAGVTPIEFYRLYDTSTENFSFVNPTANPDGTHSPLPAYTASCRPDDGSCKDQTGAGDFLFH